MPVMDKWDHLTGSDWDALARRWLAELREGSTTRDDDDETAETSVVLMNFTATPEQQWFFITAAVAHAETDTELSHIAAGPVEQLLSAHGDEYIVEVEREAESNPKFGRMMTGVWRHLMSDEVWRRVQQVQQKCSAPLVLEE